MSYDLYIIWLDATFSNGIIRAMRYTEEANKIVVSAEASLRSIAEQALLDREYGDVAHIASLADILRGVSERAESGNGMTPLPTVNAPLRAKSTRNRNKHRLKSLMRPPRGYPRFERDGDRLVKVGWSKKARGEYEHRAPRAAVLAFADQVGSKTAKGEMFAIEELLPVRSDAGEQLPSYQVYLALAWLRQAGAIVKRGRDGYTRASDPLDGSVFDTLWGQIPERS